MLIEFLFALRRAALPISITEYLALLEALERGLAAYNIEQFYSLARTILIKDERHYDRFDRAFGQYFNGLVHVDQALLALSESELPEDWLRRQSELWLSDEDKRQIEALGGWEKLMDTLRQRLQQQRGRHQGGNQWIGTAGRSPFGAYGYNPEGVRIGQHESRQRRAVKVWDQRTFRNLDDTVELGTRNIKLALRRLRCFAREGAQHELDLDATIQSTARNAGLLDLQLVPERHNAVKVLLFLDVGGSMDDHIRVCEELFSAARSEFKHIEYFYFHNCLYESVWKDNRRRSTQSTPTFEILRTYSADYRVIIVGDATMSPYEITQPGGSVEHLNSEPGAIWLGRLLETFPRLVWLNPQPQTRWGYTTSIGLIRELIQQQMYPLTLQGIEQAASALKQTR